MRRSTRMARHPVGLFMLADLPQPVTISGSSSPAVTKLSDSELAERLPSDCFVCHTPLVRGKNDSNEDLFPQWLQEAFEIRDDSINLLDCSPKTYRNVLVPCCTTCNNERMNAVEQRI